MSDLGLRAQSEVVGYVILIGIVVLSVGSLVVIGGQFITDFQATTESDRAENTVSQFGSEADRVAFGNAPSGSVQLPQETSGSIAVDPESSWLRATTENRSGHTIELLNTSLGQVAYQGEGDNIAYEGGGVWRQTDSGGQMVSPPELNYRGGTLTVSVVNVSGAGTLQSEAVIEGGESINRFPAGDASERANPISEGRITLTIHSQFYNAWADYFESRTDSDVTIDPANETVRATLLPPPEHITADQAIVSGSGLSLSGNPTVDGNVLLAGESESVGSTDVSGEVSENNPAADKLTSAESEISAAESRLGDESAPESSVVEAGEYAVDDGSELGGKTFDTSDGDIEIYVDGDLSTNDDIHVTPEDDDGGVVKIYTAGEIHQDGQSEWGNDDAIGSFVVYGETLDRVTTFYGMLYVGSGDVEGQGGSEGVVGSLVGTSGDIELGGNVAITYNDAVLNSEASKIEPEFATITYLHITEHRITVDS